MKKREIVLGSAALCLAAGLFPTAAFAVDSPLPVEGQEIEAPYSSQNVIEGDSFKSVKDTVLQNLYVGNTALVSNGEITGKTIEGVSYDPDSATLYLSGAVIDSGYEYDEKLSTAGIYCDGDLTISLSGENRIAATNLNKGINTVGKLVIAGDGDLSSASSGIYAGSITMLASGSVDVRSACECLYATSGDIDIQSGTMHLSASSNSWATVIGTVNGDLTISNADIEIDAPTDSSATYTYGTYVKGSIIIDGSSVKSIAKQDSFYAQGDITVKSGTVNAPNGVRAQQGGSIVIESGEVNVGGRGLEAIGKVALLDGTIHFSGTRLFANKVIYIDKAAISLEGSDVLKLYGTTYILNNAMPFSIELFNTKDSYLDYNTDAIVYLANPSFAKSVSYHIGSETVNGKVTEYVKGHIAHCNWGTMALEELDSLKENELLSPHSGSRHFDGWYEDESCSGNPVTSYSGGKTYYAKWLAEISFDANGGEGSMSSQRVDENDKITKLSASAFSKTGYSFVGWNAAMDGSGTAYAADAVASTVPSGTTLYAQWKANTYTVEFVGGNGATGSTESISATYDKPVTLPTNGFTKKDMKFEGWDADSSADKVVYSDATQVENLTDENDGTVTLYAVWGCKPALAPSLEAQKVTYNGLIQKFSLPDGFEVSYEQDGEKVEPKNAGSYDVVIHADETEEYAEYNATVYGGLIIEQAPLVIKADDKSMYVGGKLPEFTCSVDGLKGLDTLDSIGLTVSASCDADGKTVGNFDIVAEIEGNPENYSVKKEKGTLAVSHRPVVPSDKTEVEHNQDGSTTTTVTKPDGSQTITHETATGTESVVKKDKDGNVTSTEVTVSKQDAESGRVELPIEGAEPAADASKAPEVEVKVPSSVSEKAPVQVTVPVAKEEGEGPDYGIVVYAVDEDGNETVLPKCAVDEDGNVVFQATGDVTIKVVDAAKDMSDVTEADWFAGGVVDFATARGIVNGVALPDGSRVFDGYGKTSRGMFVAMLHNLELNPEAASEDSLADVPSDAFYADAAAWALEEGILSGVDMPDGTKQFQGDAPVTREQVAVFLMRYAESLGMDTSRRAEIGFPDASEVSGFAKEAMSWAVAEGLFKGDDATGELNPTDGAARAEVAAVLMRFINLMYA